VKTSSGKAMPLDAEPDDGKGNIAVSAAGVADVLAGVLLADAAAAKIPLHTSHFATCPNAAQHRKPK
jgi:hypothetical protein